MPTNIFFRENCHYSFHNIFDHNFFFNTCVEIVEKSLTTKLLFNTYVKIVE